MHVGSKMKSATIYMHAISASKSRWTVHFYIPTSLCHKCPTLPLKCLETSQAATVSSTPDVRNQT